METQQYITWEEHERRVEQYRTQLASILQEKLHKFQIRLFHELSRAEKNKAALDQVLAEELRSRSAPVSNYTTQPISSTPFGVFSGASQATEKQIPARKLSPPRRKSDVSKREKPWKKKPSRPIRKDTNPSPSSYWLSEAAFEHRSSDTTVTTSPAVTPVLDGLGYASAQLSRNSSWSSFAPDSKPTPPESRSESPQGRRESSAGKEEEALRRDIHAKKSLIARLRGEARQIGVSISAVQEALGEKSSLTSILRKEQPPQGKESTQPQPVLPPAPPPPTPQNAIDKEVLPEQHSPVILKEKEPVMSEKQERFVEVQESQPPEKTEKRKVKVFDDRAWGGTDPRYRTCFFSKSEREKDKSRLQHMIMIADVRMRTLRKSSKDLPRLEEALKEAKKLLLSLLEEQKEFEHVASEVVRSMCREKTELQSIIEKESAKVEDIEKKIGIVAEQLIKKYSETEEQKDERALKNAAGDDEMIERMAEKINSRFTHVGIQNNLGERVLEQNTQFFAKIRQQEQQIGKIVDNMENLIHKLEVCNEVFEREVRCPRCGEQKQLWVMWPCGHLFCSHCLEAMHVEGTTYACDECGCVTGDPPVLSQQLNALSARLTFKRSGFADLLSLFSSFRNTILMSDDVFFSGPLHHYHILEDALEFKKLAL